MTNTDTTTAAGLVQLRAPADLAAWLRDRSSRMHSGSPGLQARDELAMWQAILAAELRGIRLTLGEACAVADVLNGTLLDTTILGNVPLVWAEVSDAFYDARQHPLAGDISSYSATWGIDEQVLLDKLQALGPAADHALRDAINRWWATDQDQSADGFTNVGLRLVDQSPKGA